MNNSEYSVLIDDEQHPQTHPHLHPPHSHHHHHDMGARYLN